MELYQDKPEVEAKAGKKEEPKNKLAGKWLPSHLGVWKLPYPKKLVSQGFYPLTDQWGNSSFHTASSHARVLIGSLL